MVAELAWFEEKAKERSLKLASAVHPTARAYVDYLLATTYAPYPVQLTALWASSAPTSRRADGASGSARLPGVRPALDQSGLCGLGGRARGRRGPRACPRRRPRARGLPLDRPLRAGLLADGLLGRRWLIRRRCTSHSPSPARTLGERRIQADLKTFQRFGVYGTSALTLVTAQNSVGVRALELLSTEFVTQQIAAVAEDFEVRAAKTGALGSAEIIETVAAAVVAHAIPNLVVDPVMISKHGDPLLDPGAVEVLKARLFRGPRSLPRTSTRPPSCSVERSGARRRCATRRVPPAISEPARRS